MVCCMSCAGSEPQRETLAEGLSGFSITRKVNKDKGCGPHSFGSEGFQAQDGWLHLSWRQHLQSTQERHRATFKTTGFLAGNPCQTPERNFPATEEAPRCHRLSAGRIDSDKSETLRHVILQSSRRWLLASVTLLDIDNTPTCIASD